MKIEINPLTVQNYVIGKMPPRERQEGFVEAPKWHVSELDAETLAELATQYRKDLFEKAKKKDPSL